MNSLSRYIIHFGGLKEGVYNYDFEIDNGFFEAFEYKEFNFSKIKTLVSLEKKFNLINIKLYSSGIINIDCDVSNEPFDMTIKEEFKIMVKFAKEYNDIDDEIIFLPHGSHKIDISQYIYEMLILSIPLKKTHPGIKKGTLDSYVLKKLKEYQPRNLKKTDPRWDKLKDLL
tara:strand:+ start:536 stop:1048 length:513 start_codon:yes stop_codon:yes gene_type:complete